MPAPAPGSSDALPPRSQPGSVRGPAAVGGQPGARSPGGRRVLVYFPFFFPLCLSLAVFSQHQPPAAIPPHPARSRSSSGASCEPGRQRLEPAPPPPSSGGGRRSQCPPPLGSCLLAKPGSLLRPAGARPTEPAGAPGGALPDAPSPHLAPEGFRCCWRASERVSSPVRLLALRGSAP